jgi:uncharacterized membrane protein (DUF106 family)
MFSPLLNIVMQYGGAVLIGIVTGLICKAYFASQVQGKVRRYQGEMVKSHARILELEAKNDQLEKRLKDAECRFIKDQLVFN